MWSDKFLAKASILGYSEILLGDTEIPMDSEVIDVSTAEGRLKDKAQKANKQAFNDLLMAMQENIGFSIVRESKTGKVKEGDAKLAWLNLKKRYQPNTNANRVKLMQEFQRSKLSNIKTDPIEWVTSLELKRDRLKQKANGTFHW